VWNVWNVRIAANLTGQKKKENDGDALAALANQNTSLIVCRICGKKGDHWTSKCPYKDLAAAKGMATVRVALSLSPSLPWPKTSFRLPRIHTSRSPSTMHPSHVKRSCGELEAHLLESQLFPTAFWARSRALSNKGTWSPCLA